jgi:hypothetical protein
VNILVNDNNKNNTDKSELSFYRSGDLVLVSHCRYGQRIANLES